MPARAAATKTLLRRVGLRPGLHCLDVGCAIGAVTLKLARYVGPTGRAMGIDPDEGCLELARREAARHNLHPAFRVGGVSDLREEGVYDLVYSRFLLPHLPEPQEAVTKAALASAEVVDAVVAGLGRYARDRRTTLSLPRIFQVWGRRPVA